MPAQKPETLIQSQQVTLTGPHDEVARVLKLIRSATLFHDITVTITPTSVPNATVGVTQDSQQNPRHLKPCPFCGAEGGVDRDGDDVWVVCTNPCAEADISCPVRPATVIYDTEAEAIAAWNRRSASSDAQGSVTAQSQQNPRQDGEA